MENPRLGKPFMYVCDRANHRGGIQKELFCSLMLRIDIPELVGEAPSTYHGF